jgi:non-specific serine/threonine protein kinase
LAVVMRLVEGPDLRGLLDRDGPFEPARAVRLARQLCTALGAIHACGLVHRDVKPRNVLVAGVARDEHAYLVDFGVARAMGDAELGARERMTGTIGYAAPEQLRGEPADHRADVYGLGCVLYEMLTGAPPYGGGTRAARITAHLTAPVPDLPGADVALEEIVQRALAKSPEERFASTEALAAALDGSLRTRNVPIARPATRTIGRDDAIARIASTARRKEVRILTLTGAGGVGKTRLALAVSERLQSAFRDGVAFVSLQTVADSNLVVAAIAQALNIRESADEGLTGSIIAALRAAEMLLVLDNFEHVLPAGATVAELLMACPGLKVLATSRSLLRLSGERAVDVDPLALPDLEQLPSLEDLERIDSVHLFVAHAQQARAGFELTLPNAADVAAICTRLDGLPLAIELAAARVRILSPPALLARLEQRLHVLTAGPRDMPSRQQTMRNAIAWSYDLLSPEEQQLFQRLATFVGGWTLEAVEAVARGLPEMLDALSALVDHSLVSQREQEDGAPRYSMLETIREFGLEQLTESGELDLVRRLHAEYFLRTFEDAEVEWSGPDAARWVARSEIEFGNLRSALTWAVEHDADIAFRFIQAIGGCWETLGHYSEARRWCELALASRQPASPSLRAYALFEVGFLATTQGDYAAGWNFSEEGFALYQSLGDARGAAWCLYGMGRSAMWAADLDRAAELYESTVEAAREVDDRLLRSALGNLGAVFVLQGRYEQAERCLTEAIERAKAAHHIVGLGFIIPEYALLALRQGDLAGATRRVNDALGIQQQLRDPRYASQALEIAAWIAIEQGIAARAARLLGAASSLREAIGVRVPPMTQMSYAAYIPLAQALISPEDWDEEWLAGCALSLDEAIDLARTTEPASAEAPDPTPAAGLSPREVDVVRLLVEGMSNQQIGATLSISPHTVANHVANIMNKLGVESRTAAATWAARQGI